MSRITTAWSVLSTTECASRSISFTKSATEEAVGAELFEDGEQIAARLLCAFSGELLTDVVQHDERAADRAGPFDHGDFQLERPPLETHCGRRPRWSPRPR